MPPDLKAARIKYKLMFPSATAGKKRVNISVSEGYDLQKHLQNG